MNPCKDLIVFRRSIFSALQNECTQHIPIKGCVNSDSEMNSLIDDMYLLKLDPLKWKEQDHYRLLGLSDRREEATGAEIKAAYHKMVLRYHPDKQQQQQGENASKYETNCNIFKCIQKAYEILTDPQQRHAFDSVDPKFDESIPDPISKKKYESDPLAFYKIFIPVFNANAKFSKIKPVPFLGNPYSARKDVEAFYTFWYNFDSTRSFEYLDEEDTSQADNRYDKRYLEKKNKTARLKRKTEDNARVRNLVDNAFQSDPRLKIFKEEDKREKEAQKKLKASSLAPKKAALSSPSNTANDIASRRLAEEAEKSRLLEIKKQKELERSVLRQSRKEIRSKLKEHSFFTPSADLDLLEKRIAMIQCKLESFSSLEELDVFSAFISKQIQICQETGNVDSFYKNFELSTTPSLAAQKHTKESTEESQGPIIVTASADAPNSNRKIETEWSASEIQCLIKACNTIPGGTRLRWEKIASYVREHAGVSHTRSNDEIIEKSREIQKLGKSALDKLDDNELQLSIKKKIDPRVDMPSVPSSKDHESVQPWTKAEQLLLEEGLRKYPVSIENRWDLIADAIPSKTKKQVIERFKEIAKSVKAAKKPSG